MPSPLTVPTVPIGELGGLAVPDEAFERRMREALASEVEFISLIGEDLVTAGGKRVRPLVTLLAAQALGARPGQSAGAGQGDWKGVAWNGGDWEDLLSLSVCVELLHSASLLHDDLIDDSDKRRGRETAFRRFGNVVSVMSGDFMLARLLGVLATLPRGPELTRAFGQTASVICEGEVLQFQVASYADYTMENYLRVIHGKTAALLELAASAPALLLGRPQTELEALATFGREYGMAFQLQDDVLDLLGDEAQLGKPLGGDLREGKATFPTLLLLSGTHADEVREILERRASGPGDVERVQGLVRQSGADQATRQEIDRRATAAASALLALPPSPARHALTALAERERERRW